MELELVLALEFGLEVAPELELVLVKHRLRRNGRLYYSSLPKKLVLESKKVLLAEALRCWTRC